MAKANYSKYGGEIEEPEVDYAKYGGEADAPKAPETVNTFLGQMPRQIPSLTPGTSEFKKQIGEMIDVAGGAPGMKMLGMEALKGAGGLKNLVQTAFKSTEPYESAAAKAAQEHEAASKAAEPVKAGLYRTPMTELQDVENQIGTHINAEAEHGVRAAQGIKGRAQDIQDFWSDAYKQFENKIKDSKFQMPQTALESLGYDKDAVLAKLKEGTDPRKVMKIMKKETENPFYKQLISKAPTAKDTNPVDFLARHKDFRDTMGGLRADLKSDRYGSIEKEKIRAAIEKGKEMESQIKETLSKGLGEHKPEYDWLMKGYSEQVFPLRNNPLVEAAKKGKMPDNIIKALRTNEPGMEVLRGIIKQDPELLRNVVGQRYMKNAAEIHAPNELTREFLDEMPEFKNLLGKREETLKRTAQRENISLKNKIETENKLKEIQAAKAKVNKKLGLGVLTAVGTSATAAGVPYLSKLFTGD